MSQTTGKVIAATKYRIARLEFGPVDFDVA